MFKFSGTIFGADKINEEDIVRVIHHHWFNILQQFLAVILMALVLMGGLVFLPAILNGLQQEKDYQRLFALLENTLTLFVWIYIFFVWIDYYYDMFIISNRKIVNVAQVGLFTRQISELKFERIQDVTVEVNGLIPTMLNYGDIYIQTAGETERFIFKAMPDPYTVKNLIMNLQKERIREETNELGEVVREEINRGSR